MKITAKQYRLLRSRIDRYHQARQLFDPVRYQHGGGYSPAEEKAILKLAKLRNRPSNDQVSAVEVYEFCSDKPSKYFLYIDDIKNQATTFTGDVLGSVRFGREYKTSSFGMPSVRQPVTIIAINGWQYHGTYYKSSGNYATIRKSNG